MTAGSLQAYGLPAVTDRRYSSKAMIM